MNLMLIASTTALIIPPLVFTIAWLVSHRSLVNREKSSPFECGFDPLHSARIPFSMRFFLLAVIFIVFDIEIVLLIPMPMLTLSMCSVTTMLTISTSFLIILLLGLLHEWHEGSLNWTN